jgi:uncharacterized protein
MSVRDLIFNGRVTQLEQLLNSDPGVVNEHVSLPESSAVAHPLHRVCDAVFNGNYPEATGLEIAKVFLKNGASVNPILPQGQDSPLTAACSLRCDDIALLYIDHGADIHHRGCHGGTSLHWAAWCGRDVVVKKLLAMKPEIINLLCTDFKSTPLFWATHGYKFGGKDNRHHQVACAAMLLEHGADRTIPNFENYLPEQILGENDQDMKDVFQ